MGNRHQAVKSDTPVNKALGRTYTGKFLRLILPGKELQKARHTSQNLHLAAPSPDAVPLAICCGGCICMWEACEGVSRCVGKPCNCLWRRLYTTGIALGKMASFMQSTVYQILHWYLNLDECWTVLSVWLLALSKVKTETWKALDIAREVFSQRFSHSPSDTSPHLWGKSELPWLPF